MGMFLVTIKLPHHNQSINLLYSIETILGLEMNEIETLRKLMSPRLDLMRVSKNSFISRREKNIYFYWIKSQMLDLHK